MEFPELTTVDRENFARFIFALVALCFEGEFKTEPIEFYSNEYVTKRESGQIQDGRNNLRSFCRV